MSVVGKLEPAKVDFRWKIENFCDLMSLGVNTSRRSPHFVTLSTAADLNRASWTLRIYPGGEAEESKDHVALYAIYSGPTEVTAVCTFSASDNKTVFTRKRMRAHSFKNKTWWGFKRFLCKGAIMNDGQSLLVDDTLTISCTISVCDDYDEDKAEAFQYFEELLENKKFSDVKFAVGRKKLSLHKAILTSISPVFRAMFEHNMREKNENVVKLVDIKENVALEMFRYVYSRKVNDIDSIAGDLLTAADKYQITGLKALCERSLMNGLCVDNVLKCLQLVTMCETTFLKVKVIAYIVDHIKELIDKPEYKELNVNCKDEIIKALADKVNE